MSTRIGINGFGRIGRQTLKAILERHPDALEVVAVNDLAPTETNAHLFRYDSTYGRYDGEVTAGEGDDHGRRPRDRAFSERDPAALPWGDLGGRDRDRVDRRLHRCREGAGAPRGRRQEGHHQRARPRTRTSPSSSASTRDRYDPAQHHIVSNASLHDQRAGPAGQGGVRQLRHRARPDDDGPLLHQRPAGARRVPQGPAPGARRRPEHHPHQHRRGEGALRSSSPS